MNFKNLFLISLVLFFCSSTLIKTGSIKVEIHGLENDKGIVQIGLYNSEKDFPTFEKNFKGSSIKANKNGVHYTFTNIPVGKYAIAVWQDENEDKKINKNMFGSPTEKYGFSNNKFGTFGPPDFEVASFVVKENGDINLKINLK